MPVDINALEEWAVGDRMLNDILGGLTTEAAQAQRNGARAHCLPGAWAGVRRSRFASRSSCWPPPQIQCREDRGAGLRRRRRTRHRPTAHWDRVSGLRRPAGVGEVQQARWQAHIGVVDPVAGVGRSRPDPRLVRRLHRPIERGTAADRRPGPARRTTPSRCCAIWWRSTTRGVASRFRCPSRRPTPGPLARTTVTIRSAQAQYRWKSRPIPGRRPGARPRAGVGQDARLADLMQPLRPGEEYDGENNRLGAYAARLWLPMLRAERNPA